MAVNVSVTAGKTAPASPGKAEALATAAVEAARRLLGVEAVPESPPPMPQPYKRRHMNSIRLRCGAATFIATRRRDAKFAKHETDILFAFGARRAPAPRVLAAEGEWLIQEDVGEKRLIEPLQSMAAAEGIALLERAAAALWRCQDAVAGEKFVAEAQEFGGGDRLIAGPGRLGEVLQAPAPPLADEKILSLIRPPEAVFVKWDARPANAILNSSGAVYWIDWEEWGRRCRLDDLVWLVCDEWVPDFGPAEDEFIARQIRARKTPFADGVRGAETYVAAFGALHCLLRLDIILRAKGREAWWSKENCLAYDLIGVTRECALRLLARAQRLAAKVDVMAPLAEWTAALSGRLPP